MVPAAHWLAALGLTVAHATSDIPAQPIIADDMATVVCPDRHAAQLLFDLATSDESAGKKAILRQRYDHEVARWAVCARVMALPNWGVPDVMDPPARRLLGASLTVPGHRERIEAIEASADEMPFAASLLALEELSVVGIIGRAEPQRRVELAAAAFGAWGCGASRVWLTDPDGDELGFCEDGRSLESMATSGLLRLTQLAAPSATEGTGWLPRATNVRTAAWWAEISDTWFPLTEPPPLRVPEGGVGSPLEPGVGWSGRVGIDLVAWQERPAFQVTPTGLLVKQPSIRTSAPLDWDGAPILYIDGDLRLGRLADELDRAKVARPIFVARHQGSFDERDLVELQLLWQPDQAPPPSAAVVELQAFGGSLSRMREAIAQAPGQGPTWIRADPGARYRDLVAAHAVVVDVQQGPVFVSLRAPLAEPAP